MTITHLLQQFIEPNMWPPTRLDFDGLPSSKFLLRWRTDDSDCQSMAETTALRSRNVVEWRCLLECV